MAYKMLEMFLGINLFKLSIKQYTDLHPRNLTFLDYSKRCSFWYASLFSGKAIHYKYWKQKFEFKKYPN